MGTVVVCTLVLSDQDWKPLSRMVIFALFRRGQIENSLQQDQILHIIFLSNAMGEKPAEALSCCPKCHWTEEGSSGERSKSTAQQPFPAVLPIIWKSRKLFMEVRGRRVQQMRKTYSNLWKVCSWYVWFVTYGRYTRRKSGACFRATSHTRKVNMSSSNFSSKSKRKLQRTDVVPGKEREISVLFSLLKPWQPTQAQNSSLVLGWV